MRVLLAESQIQDRVREMARQITQDYAGREPHLVGVLKGACPFMTDLARHIDLSITLDYIAVSSYGALTKSSGEVRLVKDLDQGLDGRELLVVEDIVDTGLTLPKPPLLLPLPSGTWMPALGCAGCRDASRSRPATAMPLDAMKPPAPTVLSL
jgi:hypoxanthine phosphoribosyltransferase